MTRSLHTRLLQYWIKYLEKFTIGKEIRNNLIKLARDKTSVIVATRYIKII